VGLLVVALIWFAGMAGAALAIRPNAVVAFGMPTQMIPAIADTDGALLDAGRFHVAARTGPTTVRRLYAEGAWLVWPILSRGCGAS
jgi:hypothetical protein